MSPAEEPPQVSSESGSWWTRIDDAMVYRSYIKGTGSYTMGIIQSGAKVNRALVKSP